MNEIIQSFKETVFSEDSKRIIGNVAEITIDSILEEGLLKQIPIVSTVTSLCKIAINLHDRNLLKQTLSFINEFNSGEIDNAKLEKYKERMSNNKIAEKELGRVLIILNRIIDEKKSKILAKLYLAYINENISWDKFCELSEISEKIFVQDIEVLLDIKENSNIFNEEKVHNYLRLVSLGLLKNDMNFNSGSATVMTFEGSTDEVELTRLGIQFYDLIKRN